MPRTLLRALTVTLATLPVFWPSAALPEAGAGAYLSARHASMTSDYRTAVRYYVQAMAQDPSNPALLENALVAYVALGQFDKAVPVARKLHDLVGDNQIGDLVLLIQALHNGDFADASARIETGEGFGPLLTGLLRGWSYLGEGKMSDAAAAFDDVAKNKALGSFAYFHKALALAVVGDFEGADEILSGRAHGTLRVNLRAIASQVEVLAQLDRRTDAQALVKKAIDTAPNPVLSSLSDALDAGDAVPYSFVTTPQQGAAEVFFTLATVLSGEANNTQTLLYSRAAEYLRPGHVDAILLSAGILEEQDSFDLATDAYNRVPRDHPAFYIAETGRAEALYAGGNFDGAIEVLQALTKSHPDIASVHAALGDILRRQERHGDATRAYDAAIALTGDPLPNVWFLYYARGITQEREGKWEKSEADLRTALKLRPNEPLVLNYLGYSLVEKNKNLDEALSMIERAVEGHPNDGYITDSLGWVFYRLGRYADAVGPMEQAAELLPLDPIVNDHLGDVYWAVGRRLEAAFQWRRALSFKPEDKEAVRIRRKLEVGLDAVLQEEGAEPIAVAKGG